MGQRSRTLAQSLGLDGFRVTHYFETAGGVRIAEANHRSVPRGVHFKREEKDRYELCFS